MKFALRLSVLLAGFILLAACNPVRPLPVGGEAPIETPAAIPADAPAGDAPSAPAEDGDTAAAMAAVLARQLGVDSSEVTVVSTEIVEWPDACLGVTLEDEMCAQVITPGYKIVLSAGGATYTFHTDASGSWYRLAEGPATEIGPRLADWRGLADNGSCLQAAFGTEGVAFGGCGGVLTQGRYVSPARFDVLQAMVAGYAPFQGQVEMAAVDFAGAGSTAASAEQQAAIARWLQMAAMEAVAGQSFAGMAYAGPAELGSADTSRCAVLQISGAEAQVWDCDGTVTTMPLDNQAATWADIADRFGSFVYETPTERLAFDGMGAGAGEARQRALLAWARVTRAELATGQASATARTALSWHLGALPDTPEVCAHVTLLDYGYAYAEQRACESGELVSATEDWLDDAELAQFDRWLYGFAPLYRDDNYLNGAGAEQMPAEEAAAVEAWAAELWMRLAGLPLAAPAADAGAEAGADTNLDAGAACDATAAGGAVFRSDEYGFCLLAPAGYEVVETAPGSFSVVAGGDMMDHVSPRVSLEVTAAGDRTLGGIADQMLADYAPVGTDVTTATITLDGVDAVQLDNLPGQDLNRRVVLLHNGQVYSLMFMPLSPEAEPLYAAVLDSLRFLN